MRLKGDFIMIKTIYENENFRLFAVNSAQIALSAYKARLKTKLLAADAVMVGLKKIGQSTDKHPAVKNNTQPAKKENDDMKHFLSALTVVAAAGAVLGAAGYYVYKKTKEKDYEDLLYTEEMGEDFTVESEDYMEKLAETAADVKDTVVSAAENVKETVSDAFTDVKEAIEHAIEE